MAKNKFFSWENWWKGFVTVFVIGVIGAIVSLVSSVFSVPITIVLGIVSFVILPFVYSALIREIYKK